MDKIALHGRVIRDRKRERERAGEIEANLFLMELI